MAIQSPVHYFSFAATNDLTGKQFYLVDCDAATSTSSITNVITPTAAGQKVLGVLQNKPAAGQEAQVMLLGISKVVAGAAVAAGDLVMSDNQGRAVTATPAGAFPATNFIVGRALNAAAAAGALISVVLQFNGKE